MVHQMHPLKAPGADGMPALFYQKLGNIVSEKTTQACLQFFNNGAHLNEINHIIIHLIPKILDPTSPLNYRQISLCNVLYQIIARILENSLKAGVTRAHFEETKWFCA